MEWTTGLLGAWQGAASLLWGATYARMAVAQARVAKLGDLDPPAPARWPRLSVIVPACNEEATLEAALETLRAADYPELELVVIDDRSSDRTPEIVERAAARDPRVRAVHVRELPAGWLGKVHALQVGTEQATGEWLLYTDADVHFSPGTLRKTIALALERALDHLAVIPAVDCPTRLLELIVFAFGGMFMISSRAGDVGRPGSDAYVGVGAFNLVRREALARSEGFAWLRLEVADDMGLGLVLHRAGARAGLLFGIEEVRVEWYPSVRALVRGLEKNMFPVMARFSFARMTALLVGLWLFLGGPLAAIVAPAAPGLRALGLAAYGVLVVGTLVTAHRLRRPLWAAPLIPIGQVTMTWVLLRSAWACWRRGGIEWRGTRYATDELREGQRVLL